MQPTRLTDALLDRQLQVLRQERAVDVLLVHHEDAKPAKGTGQGSEGGDRAADLGGDAPLPLGDSDGDDRELDLAGVVQRE
jgi:hypothetical protein